MSRVSAFLITYTLVTIAFTALALTHEFGSAVWEPAAEFAGAYALVAVALALVKRYTEKRAGR